MDHLFLVKRYEELRVLFRKTMPRCTVIRTDSSMLQHCNFALQLYIHESVYIGVDGISYNWPSSAIARYRLFQCDIQFNTRDQQLNILIGDPCGMPYLCKIIELLEMYLLRVMVCYTIVDDADFRRLFASKLLNEMSTV